MRIVAAGLLLLLVALAFGLSPAAAQSLGLGALEGDEPLEVLADGGIEWRQDEKVFIAEGNARARRGEVTVHADRLVAHYRDRSGPGKEQPQQGGGQPIGPGGGIEIFRLEAQGNVRIVSRQETAVGESAVYDIDGQVFVLTGRDLSLKTPDVRITARDSLEYWAGRELAVARGDARAFGEDRLLTADVLTARFAGKGEASRNGGGGPSNGAVERIEAFDNVAIRTADEVIRGDRGVYDLDSRIATLAGSVKITRGENQLNGAYAEVNLATGVSRLRSAPGQGPSRVFGLIKPEKPSDGAAP
ncbi:MAG: LptA/OstA family protein [Acetobacterales bacterium]